MASISTASTASNAPIVNIPAIVFCVATPLIVGVRVWVRLRTAPTLGIDDWVILLATIFGLASNGVLIAACHYGYGIHGADLTVLNKKQALLCFYLSQIFYKCSINITKASTLFLYLRIFVQKTFRLVCWALLAFVAAFGVSTTVASIFQCTPIPRAWNKAISGHCINATIFWYTNASFSILGYIIILACPMPLILGLRLQLNQKLSLVIVFALGIFVVITSVLRMRTLNTTSETPDPTFEIEATMWTVIELNIAIICACLPMCRMPLAKLFAKLFGSSHPDTMASFTHAGTSKNDLTPRTHDRNKNRSKLASVVAGGDDNSEEFILQDRNGTHMHPIGSDVRIQKTTRFEIRYEENGSAMSGESTPHKFESKFDLRA